ncbi:MAG: hypothetical protein ABJC19_09345 [Gemmatimonadota bacterium]
MRYIDGALLMAVILPLRLDGQQPAALSALLGSWRLDPARSDSGPDLRPSRGPMMLVPRDKVVTVGAGGGAGQQRPVGVVVGGGRTPAFDDASITGPGAAGIGPTGGVGMRPEEPRMRAFAQELRTASVLTLKMRDEQLVIANETGYSATWLVTGVRTQEAQMEGGVVEFEAKWKGKTLVVERASPGEFRVIREFKPSADGQVLEVKTTMVQGPGFKANRHAYYTRMEAAP